MEGNRCDYVVCTKKNVDVGTQTVVQKNYTACLAILKTCDGIVISGVVTKFSLTHRPCVTARWQDPIVRIQISKPFFVRRNEDSTPVYTFVLLLVRVLFYWLRQDPSDESNCINCQYFLFVKFGNNKLSFQIIIHFVLWMAVNEWFYF